MALVRAPPAAMIGDKTETKDEKTTTTKHERMWYSDALDINQSKTKFLRFVHCNVCLILHAFAML